MSVEIFLGEPPPHIKQWIKDHHGPSLNSPLCFTAEDAGATITFKKQGSPDAASIVYATESPGQRAALDWQPYTFNTTITLANVGDKVYFRAADENDILFYKDSNNYYKFNTTSGKRIAASGNIQTLMKADGSRLDISGKIYCYFCMFQGCTSLTTAPILPATTLATGCYSQMFSNCTSLTSAPALPATTLASNCYNSMFKDCSSLTSAPALPATTLANSCYYSMFNGCTALTTASSLPAETLADYCYTNMFFGCTSLAIAPALPATTLANSCYSYMFSNCISLTTAPALPATTLANSCYYYMFSNCISLTTAPALSASALANSCYYGMFLNCPNVQEITFANLTCKYVVEHALEWGLGIDINQHTFLVIAYCSDGVVVINNKSGSSSN